MRTKSPMGKLVLAGVSLLMAIALLAVGTFAWFTFSAKPEVSGISVSFNSDSVWPFEISTDYDPENPDAATWEKELCVSEMLVDNAALRPISTYDMQHWYLPDYDLLGNVTKLVEVPLSDVANRTDKSTTTDTPPEDGINYVLYFDMWVRTRDPELKYELRLSNPMQNESGITVNDGETVYGTYVLWTPTWDTTNNTYTAADYAMSSIRVGFQAFDQASGTDVKKTVIYEPNIDLHNGLGASATDARYSGIRYIGGSGVSISSATDTYLDNGIYSTTVPKASGTSSYTMVVQETTAADHGIIRQRKSSWDQEKIEALNGLTAWDSTFIKSIGQFVDENGATIFAQDLPSLATIDKEHPGKIRVFFWLEGQDVDCWNQIAGGSIYANLELRGDAVQG